MNRSGSPGKIGFAKNLNLKETQMESGTKLSGREQKMGTVHKRSEAVLQIALISIANLSAILAE